MQKSEAKKELPMIRKMLIRLIQAKLPLNKWNKNLYTPLKKNIKWIVEIKLLFKEYLSHIYAISDISHQVKLYNIIIYDGKK